MLSYTMNPKGILVLEPHGTLNKEDFEGLSDFVDTYLADHKDIHGVIIHSESFPGWDSFAGFATHMRFVRDHHRKIKRLAVVTDSSVAGLAESLGKHFIAAEIKRFPYIDYEIALDWLAPKSESRESESNTRQAGSHIGRSL